MWLYLFNLILAVVFHSIDLCIYLFFVWAPHYYYGSDSDLDLEIKYGVCPVLFILLRINLAT